VIFLGKNDRESSVKPKERTGREQESLMTLKKGLKVKLPQIKQELKELVSA
jgi:hypothetical protein